jgi:hypothetical protein
MHLCKKLVGCKGEISQGYRVIRDTEDGRWGMLLPDTSEEWSREQLEERRREWERQQQLAKAERVAKEMPAAERDKHYRWILSQLDLHPEDRQDLIRRGYTDEQIQRAGHKSVEQWQKLPGKLPLNLPGVNRHGDRLITHTAGYLCPIPDVDGLIVGFQVRKRHLAPDDDQRYYFLSQNSSIRISDQLPLAVFQPIERKGDHYEIVEGVGAKPFLACDRLEVPVIGAAGGNSASSAIHLKNSLQKLGAKPGDKVVLAADAGSPKNPSVLRQYKRTVSVLEQEGYQPFIRWWGQVDKSHPDIDELSSFEAHEFITPKQFFDIANHAQQQAEQEEELRQERLKLEAVEAEQTDTSTSTKPQSNSSKEYVPFANSEIKFRVKRRTSDQERFLKSFSELHTEAGNEWLKLRRFTPDETIDLEYFYYEPPQEGEGLAAQSGLGTGKSFYTNRNYIGKDDGAISFGNRNTTLGQFVEDGKKEHKRDWYLIQKDLKEGGRDDLRLIQDPQSKIISCIDSILYVRQQDATDKKVVLDEVESTLKHLNYSTTAVSYHRQHCKQRLAEIATEAHSLFLADGNLKDITVRYLELLSGKKIKKVKNIYKGNRGKVTYYIGSERFEENKETNKIESVERRFNDYSHLLKTMLQDPEPFIAGSDSQEQLEAWDRQFKEKGRRTFRLDSTTSNTPEGEKCILDPAKYIQENKIDVFLYSPSADQGLSINLKGYFKRGYYFFFGVVSTDSQIQFLGRLRDAECHLHVFCQTKHKDANSINKGLLSEGIQQHFLEYARACASLSLSDVDEENRSQKLLELAYKMIEKSNDIHYQYECQLLAMAYFEQNNLRNCLEYAMREAGWQVQAVTGSKISTKEQDKIKATIRTERAERILVAAPLSATEAKEIKKQGIAKEEDKPKLVRHKLLERIPGIEAKTITQKKIIRVPAPDPRAEKTLQNLAVSEAESPSPQDLNPVHTCPNNSINSQGDCGQPEGVGSAADPSEVTGGTDGFIEVEQEVTRSVFDADFIKRVKFQDRGLISRLEGQVLLRNPQIAKLAQQKKWQKKLALFQDETQVDGVKRINLTTYKSPWLKINTLLEMGIGYFLQPESTWMQDTPEAIAFWEQGKDPKIARQIGLEVGESDVCQYIGRILDSYGLKRESEKIKLPTGERVRQYRPKPLDPICQAIYECVETKVLASTGEEEPVLDWEKIIEKSPPVGAESPSPQALNPVHTCPNNSINSQEDCGQAEGVGSELEQLVEALPFAETAEDFASIVEGSPLEAVEEAIALQDTQPRRQQLQNWFNQQRVVDTIKAYGQLLAEALDYGVDAIKAILQPWTTEERRGAILEFRQLAPGKMEQLAAIVPDWVQWCG